METLFGAEFKSLDSIIYLKGNVKPPYTYKFIISKLYSIELDQDSFLFLGTPSQSLKSRYLTYSILDYFDMYWHQQTLEVVVIDVCIRRDESIFYNLLDKNIAL